MSALTQSPPARRLGAAGSFDWARVIWLLVGGLLVARIGLSLHMLSSPGLQYDETLFVNAATLQVPGDFLLHGFHGIPLMVFPYIGALKSWLYDPIFAVFGTSASVIRLPAVLIVCAGLLLLYAGVRDLVNRPVAVLVFVALCFDASLFWLTRDDVGPSALEFFFKCAAIFCVARFARRGSILWVLLLLAALALGLFNKLNFIWVVNAAVAISVVAIVRYRDSLRTNRRLVALWVCGLAILYGAFALYYFGDHVGTLLQGASGGSLSHRVTLFQQGTRAVISGTWFYDYALAPLGPRNAVVVIVGLLFLAGAVASIAFPRTRSLPIAALALATVLIVVQIVITKEATAGWHYISIYPFVTIVAAYGAYALAHAVLRRELAVGAALAGVGALALAYDGVLLTKYFSALHREPINPAWSGALYRLSGRLARSPARIYTADWGIFNPVFALKPSRRYNELAFALHGPAPGSLQNVTAGFAHTPGPKLIVTHPNSKLEFPDVNANLFKALGHHLRLTGTVAGLDGRPVYLIYAYH